MKLMLEKGVVQQALQLLPHIPNILVRVCPHGCALFSLNGNVDHYKSVHTNLRYLPAFTLISHGRTYDEAKTLGMTIEYFAVPPEIANLTVMDITGEVDALLGYLISLLTK